MRAAVRRETPDDFAAYFDRLWPLMRSITGDGVRRTHDILSELLPLERTEIPTGTPVLDWSVPQEWAVRQAYMIDPGGRRILDVADSTLRLVNYSVPFRGRLSRRELDEHLHSLPDQPQAVPYVTSYYRPRWGFCLSERERRALPDGDYEVVVDTELFDGSLTLSEAVLPGEEKDEALISTYTCHPSLANNELSGPLVAAFLYRRLAQLPRRRLTYRFHFGAETIGTIAYLARMGDHLQDFLVAGYVVTCVGMPGKFTYKRSRRGDTQADRAATYVLGRVTDRPVEIRDFDPLGSEERHYCSPGFDLPVGSIMTVPYYAYPEYHTSLDDRDLVSFQAMVDAVDIYFETLTALELNVTYRATVTRGEPQFAKRGIEVPVAERWCMNWVINLSDGDHDLLSIAAKSGNDLDELSRAAARCCEAGLLERVHRSRDLGKELNVSSRT